MINFLIKFSFAILIRAAILLAGESKHCVTSTCTLCNSLKNAINEFPPPRECNATAFHNADLHGHQMIKSREKLRHQNRRCTQIAPSEKKLIARLCNFPSIKRGNETGWMFYSNVSHPDRERSAKKKKREPMHKAPQQQWCKQVQRLSVLFLLCFSA